MQINVTQKHIDNGVKSDCARCPIALALKEVFPSLELTVGMATIRRSADTVPEQSRKDRAVATLPSAAIRFISKFDNAYLLDYTPEPFSFEVPDDLEVRYNAITET